MATLQNTTVPDNGYYRVGNSANIAYISSGGSLANFGNNAWYNGSTWQSGSVGGGPALQLTTDTLKFYNNPVISTTNVTFSNSEATTTLASTTTTVVVASGNTTTNSTLGVGAAAGAGATDGKILVNAGDAAGNVKPIFEVTNCLGDGSISTSTYSVFKGYLAIKIGTVVGPATSVPAGTHYIRLWSNA
jgi:hypothetical protein